MRAGLRGLAAALLAVPVVAPVGAAVADPLHIYAAGSLTGAFTDMVKAFAAPEEDVATPVFGPSGVLRAKIEHGDRVDLFASADMEQPRVLARGHSAPSVVMFTRNRLCALGLASRKLTPDNLLDKLLDSSVRLATSTPGADPGGERHLGHIRLRR
jgi:molybdate transport system substrate-binding protein